MIRGLGALSVITMAASACGDGVTTTTHRVSSSPTEATQPSSCAPIEELSMEVSHSAQGVETAEMAAKGYAPSATTLHVTEEHRRAVSFAAVHDDGTPAALIEVVRLSPAAGWLAVYVATCA